MWQVCRFEYGITKIFRKWIVYSSLPIDVCAYGNFIPMYQWETKPYWKRLLQYINCHNWRVYHQHQSCIDTYVALVYSMNYIHTEFMSTQSCECHCQKIWWNTVFAQGQGHMKYAFTHRQMINISSKLCFWNIHGIAIFMYDIDLYYIDRANFMPILRNASVNRKHTTTEAK